MSDEKIMLDASTRKLVRTGNSITLSSIPRRGLVSALKLMGLRLEEALKRQWLVKIKLQGHVLIIECVPLEE